MFLSVHLLKVVLKWGCHSPAATMVMVPAPMGFLERQRRLAVWSEYAIANSVAIPPITRYHNVIRQHILPGLPVGLLPSKESYIALVISQLRKLSSLHLFKGKAQ